MMELIAVDTSNMDIAKWVALVVAVLGMCLLFSDLILNIKKRNNTRLNVLGFVFLTLSVVCYVLTQFVFKDQLPPLFTLFWIPFLAAYLVCDIIAAVCIARQNSRAVKQKEEMQQISYGEEASAEQALQEAVPVDVKNETDSDK